MAGSSHSSRLSFCVRSFSPCVSPRSCTARRCPLSTTVGDGTDIHSVMDNNMMLWLIILGIGGGMTLGRWRAERLRARRDMHNVWAGKDKYRDYKKWKIIRH